MTRALYVDIDLIHLNPTATYFPQLIEAAVPDVSFYGPGFSSPDVLARGLLSWIRETGPYEVIFMGIPCSWFRTNGLDRRLCRDHQQY